MVGFEKFVNVLLKLYFFGYECKIIKKTRIEKDFYTNLFIYEIELKNKLFAKNKNEVIHDYRKRNVIEIATLENLTHDLFSFKDVEKIKNNQLYNFIQEYKSDDDFLNDNYFLFKITLVEPRIRNKNTNKIRKPHNRYFLENTTFSKRTINKICQSHFAGAKFSEIKERLLLNYNLDVSIPEFYKIKEKYLISNGFKIKGIKTINESFFDYTDDFKQII